MKIYESINEAKNISKGWALTVGNFDGVHLGHQQIINTAKEAAKRLAANGLVVMTFDPHPLALLHPDRAPGVLSPLIMKKNLLEKSGVDCLIILRDSYDLLNLSPWDFVEKYIVDALGAKVVVEGSNFNFGYGRSGNVNTLKQLGSQKGFEVVEIPTKRVLMPDLPGGTGKNSVACSSSIVRNFLEKGLVSHASAILGRPYKLIGSTIKGRGIGTKIGFPTANMLPLPQVIPAEGVYAGRVAVVETLEKTPYAKPEFDAVFSIGRAKTFVTEHPLLIEAHILDKTPSPMYGKAFTMDFHYRLRGQRRFESKEKLAAQIKLDCNQAAQMLKNLK
jgi:riboflavin kinase/FMN adenylyltransferase